MKTGGSLVTFFIIATLFPATPALGWGTEGHNAIAHIAQQHLTRRADREVTRLLEGRSMAYWSAWADGLRGDGRYDLLSTWHYANADEGLTYAAAPKNPAGDVYTAVVECVSRLEERGTSDSLRAMYLKLLIHFVGDMHCPMHAGHPEDRGGNDFPVRFQSRASNLHRLWDSEIVDAARPWDALEWAVNLDYGTQRRRPNPELSAGEPLDWMEQTVVLSHRLYDDTPRGENPRGENPRGETISRAYITRYTPVIEQKFLEAGHRLARLLNELFP